MLTKAIPARRDRAQSAWLVALAGTLLIAKTVWAIHRLHDAGALRLWFWVSWGCSATFGLLVWRLRAATAPAAAMGAVICLDILLRQGYVPRVDWLGTAMPALVALFVLTFAATRFGRASKEAMGTAEAKTGRRTSQILANLGAAGLCASGGGAHTAALMAACLAALAEATADTVSSEMGQVFAGSRWGATLLITTGRRVPAGTDGAISLAGTAFGVAAALAIALVSPYGHTLRPLLVVFGASCVGLFFDSVLGATVERKGWLGNDLVNFSSTVFAAALAYVLL
jgi:uncharacterized protein (TIGR00297 family)